MDTSGILLTLAFLTALVRCIDSDIITILTNATLSTIGVFNLYPPTQSCLDPDCRYTSKFSDEVGPDRQLAEPKIYKATLFMKDHGSIPIHIMSYYCRCECLLHW